MKKLKISLIISTLLFSMLSFTSTETKAQVSVSFQFFYDNLSPYGSWVNYPGYGYAWVPAHAVGFRPYYSGGHWAFTDYGWMWVSDYAWGWAPFHYGTWVLDPMYGWVWVPGYDWAPAWVTWGYYDGYYGWAPCAPGFSINVGYRPPIDYWVFAHPHYMMTGEMMHHSYVSYNRRINIGNNTVTDVQRISPVGNTAQQSGRTYFAGPTQQEFQRNGNISVKPVSVREAPRPGKAEVSGDAVNVYRPRVTQMEDARPSKVSRLEDVKPAGKTEPAQGAPAQTKPRGTDIQSRPRENAPAQTKPQAPRTTETPRETKQAPQVKPVERPREMKPQAQPAPGPQQPRNVEQPKEAPRQREVTPPGRAPEQPKQMQRQQPREQRQMRQQRQSVPRDMGQGRPMPPQPQMQPQQQEHGRRK